MKQHTSDQPPYGFTIIEVLIVLAIVGILILMIFGAVPAAQRNQRNHTRKHTMELIGGALQEYYNTYGSMPLTASQMTTFKNNTPELTKYYALDFRNPSDPHTYYPPMDTVAVQIGQWCNKYGNGDNSTDPIAGTGTSSNLYAVWTLLEPDNSAHHNVACIDNYDNSPGP